MNNYVADYTERLDPQEYHKYYCKQCSARVAADKEYCNKECENEYSGVTL